MEFLTLTNVVTDDYIKQTERTERVIIPKSRIVEVSERTDCYDADSCYKSQVIVLYNTCHQEYLVIETIDEIYDMLK